MKYLIKAKDVEELKKLLQEKDLNIDEVNYSFLKPEEAEEMEVEYGAIVEENAPERAARLTRRLLYLMNFKAKVKATEDEENLSIEIEGNDLAPLIGSRGRTLFAFQTILGAVLNKEAVERKRIYLDIASYRKRKEERIKNAAVKAAKKALSKGEKVSLEPMRAYDRRLVHQELNDFDGVETYSQGEEPERYVIINPVGGKEESEEE